MLRRPVVRLVMVKRWGGWGVDDGITNPQIQSRAIQNSWALEFDSFSNTQSRKGSAFDTSVGSYPHIASNYPGAGLTYVTNNLNPDNPYVLMQHQGVIQNNSYSLLSNGAWHHVTMRWDATAKTMTYSYNDKDPSTGNAQTPVGTKTVSIDTTKIDPNNTGYARWGFTGSTGTNWENNLVIFEQVPGVVNSSASVTATDLTTDKVIAAGDTVTSGDQLQLAYKLNYDSGSQDWKDIVAKIAVPNNMTVSYARVTYADGKSELIDPGTISAQTLKYQLTHDLNGTNAPATITIIGNVMGVKNATTAVAAAKSTFNGSNALTNATTPNFTISAASNWYLRLFFGTAANGTKTSQMDLDAVKDTTLTGHFTYSLTSTASDAGYGGTAGKAVTLRPTVNGQTQTSTTAGDGGTFSYTVPASLLLPGANTVTLYATYNGGTNVSDVIKATINVGSLTFSNVTSNIAFNAELTGTAATIAPSSQPNISVADTRVTGKHWALSASLTGLAASFPGEVVYQPGNGNVTTLSNQDAAIDTGDSAATTTVSKQWSSTWTDSSSKGLFLKIPSATTAGNYDGTITWSLKDAPS
ncbi:hypothetical protein [Levilactobacillus brevis]|uniref:hypothetical protein n=1 Tax=Levilactobacillus brevis TaxID=1580 RepID=UPI001179C4DD|nr:hypothetical protein [Levilactobacillus brevis]